MSAKQKSSLADFIKSEYYKLEAYIRKHVDTRLYNLEPDDLIQDVALNLFNRLNFSAPVENLAGYYYRALRNRITDFLRKPKQNRSIEDYQTDEAGENYFMKTFSPEIPEEDLTEREMLFEIMYECLDHLKQEQREVIVKTELEGVKFENYARELGQPLGTVLARKHRAMARLQELVQEKLNQLYDY